MSGPYLLNGDASNSDITIAIVENTVKGKLMQTIYGKNRHFYYLANDDFTNTAKEVKRDIEESGDYTLEDFDTNGNLKIIIVYDSLEIPSDTLAVSNVLGFEPEVIILSLY